MLKKQSLSIFTTSRVIRYHIAKFGQKTILANFISIQDFFNKVVFIPNKHLASETERILCLHQAADFDDFKDLKFERSFLNFLKHSQFFLGFFDELSKEKVSFNSLQNYDLYLDYKKHLSVLEKLLINYQKILAKKGLTDIINLTQNYNIHEFYLKQFECIDLYFEGYLSLYELEILSKIAKLKPLNLHYNTSNFSAKMQERFNDLYNVRLEANTNYKINLSKRKIINKESNNQHYKLLIYECDLRLKQAALVKKIIYEHIHINKIKPENIVIILPDESFANTLALFDEQRNFNFAMGKNFKQSLIYQQLLALQNYHKENNNTNSLRLKRFNLTKKLTADFDKVLDQKTTLDFLRQFVSKQTPQQEQALYLEQLHSLSLYLHEFGNLSLAQVLELFLQLLANKALDDSSGGKITVMGLLETRGLSFEAVIVVDFNETFIPKQVNKDLFLNSFIRTQAGLPSNQDRENLQRHFFEQLFSKAKFSSLLITKNTEQQPSKFLYQLHGKKVYKKVDFKLDLILYNQQKQWQKLDEARFHCKIDLSQDSLSASKLKLYLQCKRCFFYKYIDKIPEVNIPQDYEEEAMGTFLHKALNQVLTANKHYSNGEQCYQALQNELIKIIPKDERLIFEARLWLIKLKLFIEQDFQRIKENHLKIAYTEKQLEGHFEGIKIHGYIDRIDIDSQGALHIIDYKSGNSNNIKAKDLKTIEANLAKEKNNIDDFQLVFYYLLASKLGKVKSVAFYDLNEAKIIQQKHLEEKIELLKQVLQDYKDPQQNFNRSSNSNHSKYCPYQMLCQES